MPQAGIAQGNAYLVNTPKVDRYEQMVVNDYRQRELNEQRNQQLLDHEFSRNASAIRDIDVPLAYDAYQQYKNIGKQLYKNENKMSDAERIQLQLKKQRAASDYFSLVNGSKELKEVEDTGQKGYMKDPYKFDENTANYLTLSRRTPLNQHPGFNDVVNNIQLKTRDFSKDVAGAIGGTNGKPNKINTIRTPSADNLTTTPTDVYAYNAPSQFAATLIEKMPDPRSKTAFVNQHSYNDLSAQDLLSRYQQLRETPEFKTAYPNEPPINTEALNDPYTKAITLTAIDHILRHPPTMIKGKEEKNEVEFMKAKNAEWGRRKAAMFDEWKKKNKITSDQKDARTLANKAGDPNVAFPLDKFAEDYAIEHPIKDSDGKTISTMNIVYEDALPAGKLNRYNKLVKTENGDAKEVKAFKDANGRRYYTLSKNDEGHTELLGEKGKIEADESRFREINNVPANKTKQGIYFNKGEGTPATKSVPASKIKSLVGTKGYEGYTEQELIDYYKSNGYEVK